MKYKQQWRVLYRWRAFRRCEWLVVIVFVLVSAVFAFVCVWFERWMLMRYEELVVCYWMNGERGWIYDFFYYFLFLLFYYFLLNMTWASLCVSDLYQRWESVLPKNSFTSTWCGEQNTEQIDTLKDVYHVERERERSLRAHSQKANGLYFCKTGESEKCLEKHQSTSIKRLEKGT